MHDETDKLQIAQEAGALTGFTTLFYKEWLRFWKVNVQTILAPVLSALLFLLVFGHTLRNTGEPYPGVGYTAFLVPGLAMMSMLQNAFANSSSSLSHLNPFFYIVDGFRYGFFGVGDVSPWLSAGIVAVCLLVLSMLTLWLVKTGYKMRH